MASLLRGGKRRLNRKLPDLYKVRGRKGLENRLQICNCEQIRAESVNYNALFILHHTSILELLFF